MTRIKTNPHTDTSAICSCSICLLRRATLAAYRSQDEGPRSRGFLSGVFISRPSRKPSRTSSANNPRHARIRPRAPILKSLALPLWLGTRESFLLHWPRFFGFHPFHNLRGLDLKLYQLLKLVNPLYGKFSELVFIGRISGPNR